MENKIATTIEQSKKLIELGLNDSTADMYYPSDESMSPKVGVPLMLSSNIPAWSLSALYDILPSTIEGKYDLHTYKYDIDGHSYQSVMYIDLVNDEDCCLFDEEGVFDAVFKMVCWLLEHGYINKDIKL